MGKRLWSGADRARLAEVRASGHVDHAAVRQLKQRALGAAFERFRREEWLRDSDRARSLRAYVAEQSWWIDDYSLFRAIHMREEERAWMDWPDALRNREPRALAAARAELADEMLWCQYLQWLADMQWRRARTTANAAGVSLFGDLPFMVDGDSADVWANQPLFMLDASVGVPPDAFSAKGQDWGMPVYRWDVMAAEDFRWLRDRARRNAHLYDGYRVDHLVGFYRTYGRPRAGGQPFFSPAEESEQLALGERVMAVFREPGAEIIAEDLGTVPDFVRASLARLGVPGFRVSRWEREWLLEGHPFRDPADYPAESVAITGTHDTEPLAVWWTQASREERTLVAEIPTVSRIAAGVELVDAPYNPVVRDVLLASLFASGSNLLLLAVQDVFGWRDRINEPATVNDQNWTYHLPWPCDRCDEVEDMRERRDRLRAWSKQYGRM